jgi:L-carnitine CoA-transferase
VQYAALGTYACADGEFLTLVLGGVPSFRKAIPFFGLAYGSELFPEGIGQVFRGTPAGQVLGEAIQQYMQSHTADEAEAELTAIGLMAQKVYTPSDIRVDPHLAARGIFEQITTRKGVDLTYVGGVPRFTQDPGTTWRAAPWWGMDNEAILAGLGYDEAAIQDLYDDAIVTHDPEMKFSYPY